MKKQGFTSAKGMIYLDDMIILIRREATKKSFPLCLDLPGGKREDNETPEETFIREVKEELGLELNPGDIVFKKTYPSVTQPDKAAYFMVARPPELTEDEIVFGDEGTEYVLMSPEKFLKQSDAVLPQQNRVREYLNRG